MLGSSGGELVCGFEDAGEDLLGGDDAFRLSEELLDARDHAVLAPLFVGGGHGFGDAVGEGDEDVSGLQENAGTGVRGVGDEADDGAGGLEVDDLRAAKNDGRVVAGVDVGEDAGLGVELGIEEGRVAVGGGGLVDEPVDVAHEGGEVAGLEERGRAQAGTEAGHQERGGDALAGDVAEGEGEALLVAFMRGEDEEVVVVAADGMGGAAVAGEIDAGDAGVDLGEEALLHLTGDLDLS